MGLRSTVPVGLVACLVLAAVACSPIPGATGELARRDCRTDADPRAGASRTAILFVRSHVYVGDDGMGPTFAAHFVDLVPRLVRAVNDHLESNGAGLVLVEVGTNVTVSRAMYAVDTRGAGGTPAGASLADVDRVAAEAPHEVHVHFSPKSTSRVTGYGGPPLGGVGTSRTNWIGYIEDPVSGRPRTDAERTRLLAHELGHYLGLAHTAVPGNLMKGPEHSSGGALTPAQVRDMHRVVNTDRNHLLVVSCRRGAGVADLLREYPGRELLRLAAGD